MLHLNGNVRQWLIDSFNGSQSARDRPAEFAAQGGVEASALIQTLGTTVREASDVLARLTEDELGQIVYITKQIRGVDLGFYRELNQTGWASGQ